MRRSSLEATALALVSLCVAPPAAAAAAQVITVTAAPANPTSEPSYADAQLFTSAVLNSTNAYRAQHGAGSMRWNATLASFAAAYLASPAVGPECKFEHSGGPYGENLALGFDKATAAVEAWGDERGEYDFAHPGFTHETGHFTQLVWRDTTDVGCGSRLCGTEGWYLVCEYWPRGNIQGQYADEVGGPSTTTTATGTGTGANVVAESGRSKGASKTTVVMVALTSVLLQVMLIISGLYLYTKVK